MDNDEIEGRYRQRAREACANLAAFPIDVRDNAEVVTLPEDSEGEAGAWVEALVWVPQVAAFTLEELATV